MINVIKELDNIIKETNVQMELAWEMNEDKVYITLESVKRDMIKRLCNIIKKEYLIKTTYFNVTIIDGFTGEIDIEGKVKFEILKEMYEVPFNADKYIFATDEEEYLFKTILKYIPFAL